MPSGFIFKVQLNALACGLGKLAEHTMGFKAADIGDS